MTKAITKARNIESCTVRALAGDAGYFGDTHYYVRSTDGGEFAAAWAMERTTWPNPELTA